MNFIAVSEDIRSAFPRPGQTVLHGGDCPVTCSIAQSMPPLKDGGISMDHPAFWNQDLIPAMSPIELKEISDIKEIKRSLNATIIYLENRERSIFSAVRARQGGESNVQVD